MWGYGTMKTEKNMKMISRIMCFFATLRFVGPEKRLVRYSESEFEVFSHLRPNFSIVKY